MSAAPETRKGNQLRISMTSHGCNVTLRRDALPIRYDDDVLVLDLAIEDGMQPAVVHRGRNLIERDAISGVDRRMLGLAVLEGLMSESREHGHTTILQSLEAIGNHVLSEGRVTLADLRGDL